ncbi:MAG: hypothetical protein H6905_03125 [Hyphomicrobiales bacterium]|nr:hypothetical protein [Hyphomicrobiales bacterium]
MSRTIRDKAWSDFVLWCRRYGLKPFPSHPWTIAAYARWCEPRHRYATIVNRIRAIARVHVLKCAPAPDRHPVVVRTLLRIELRHRSRSERADLFADESGGDAQVSPGGRSDKSPRAKKRARTSARRLMKATPRLVSRRPAGG